MKRGRPPQSLVRQRMVDMLFFMGKGYGYDIYRHYCALFPKVSMRLIYYHLKKGLELQELAIDSIDKEKGDYSWGEMAEKIYYKLGEHAKPNPTKQVKEYFDGKA